jgi:hypothetical protein
LFINPISHFAARISAPRRYSCLSLGIHWAEKQGAFLGFQDGKGAAVTEPAPIPNCFENYDLAVLAYVNHCHGTKLPPAQVYSKPILAHSMLPV